MFYFIMVFLFSQVYSVLGLGNPNIKSYAERENNMLNLQNFADK